MQKYGSYEVKRITHGTYNRLLGQSAYKSKNNRLIEVLNG